MTPTNSLVTLNNGMQMQALCLSVFQSKPEEAYGFAIPD
jgi:hypothetical protein